MDELRREELTRLWSDETGEEDTQAYREELTAEERDFIASLDRGYRRGVLRMCSTILIREQVRRRFGPCEIRALEDLGDCCRLTLGNGSIYLARLDRENQLVLQSVDAVC